MKKKSEGAVGRLKNSILGGSAEGLNSIARLKDVLGSTEDLLELSGLWDSPEGRAFHAIDAEAIALCRAAEAEFDATEDRAVFAETPWIPAELREVIEVAFRCAVEERAADVP